MIFDSPKNERPLLISVPVRRAAQLHESEAQAENFGDFVQRLDGGVARSRSIWRSAWTLMPRGGARILLA